LRLKSKSKPKKKLLDALTSHFSKMPPKEAEAKIEKLGKSLAAHKPKILGVIPARGGSKGIKNKNIAYLRGRPLVGWAVKACKGSEMLDWWWVSTDDDEVARIAVTYGAEILDRPKNISGDTARDITFLKHSVKEAESANIKPDIIAWFPPDCPIRGPKDIDEVLRYMVKKNLDSIRTAIEAPIHPLKMWVQDGMELLSVLGLTRFGNLGVGVPRQVLPQAFAPFGLVNATKTSFIKQGQLWGPKHEFYMVDPAKYLDIDTPEQLEKAQTKVREFGIK